MRKMPFLDSKYFTFVSCSDWDHRRTCNIHQVSLPDLRITLSSMQERKSPFSAYFKIMTNHMHLIFLTASFDLSWPQVISEFFNSTEPVANISDRIISFDCFIDSTGTLSFNSSV